VAFGSLTQTGPFDDRSDIDLAVTGIAPEQFYQAYAVATAVCRQFDLDVVDLDSCAESLRDVISREGVPL
jgi:hypothetical protein